MLEVHKFHEPGVPADSPRDDVYTSSTCTHAMDRRQLPTYTVALTCLQSIGRTLDLQAVLVIGHDLSLYECRRSTPLFCERSLLSMIGVYSRFIAKPGNLILQKVSFGTESPFGSSSGPILPPHLAPLSFPQHRLNLAPSMTGIFTLPSETFSASIIQIQATRFKPTRYGPNQRRMRKIVLLYTRCPRARVCSSVRVLRFKRHPRFCYVQHHFTISVAVKRSEPLRDNNSLRYKGTSISKPRYCRSADPDHSIPTSFVVAASSSIPKKNWLQGLPFYHVLASLVDILSFVRFLQLLQWEMA
jgi:hypothetical protein